MKQLTAQILGMYLGCEAETPARYYPDNKGKSKHKTGKLMDIDLSVDQVWIWFADREKTNLENYQIKDIKLILRPLSSMTEEEAREFLGIKNVALRLDIYRKANDIPDMLLFTPNEIIWLLSHGFDLFNLIPEGLAIEKPIN